MLSYDLQINGQAYTVEAEAQMPLLWVLRDLLGLTGTKFSCGAGFCGSCTVLMDGEPARSCITLVENVARKTITTIEGLSPDISHPLQKAWLEEHVTQCGYCQPGQIMNAASLLQKNPHPSDTEIDAALSDVLCRCGTYQRIRIEAHATMEPMNCTAHVHDGICEVWAPTQGPQGVQMQVAMATRVSSDNVIVNVTLIGGGFGRRLQADYAVEAALVSQAVAAPVQVVWTRDHDLQHDFYHDLSVQYVSVPREKIGLPRVQASGSRSGVPTGAWRSVTNFPAAYASQCFIDEMAHELKRDPLDLWLELYSDRAAGVIQLAAEKAE